MDGINEPEQRNENVHTILGDHKLKTEGMARGTAKTEEGLRTTCPAPALNRVNSSPERRERQCNSAASASAQLFMVNALGQD